MSKLLIVNYSMDESSTVFAHSITLVNSFASRFDQIEVITLGKLNCKLASNVKVRQLSWDSRTIFGRIIMLYLFFCRYAVVNRKFVFFSHMAELPFLLLAPLVRLQGNKAFLWYAHASRPRFWSLIIWFASKVFSSTPGSAPKPHANKIEFIGQGIDPKIFKFTTHVKRFQKFLIVGRIDPSKRVRELVETFHQWKQLGIIANHATLSIAGKSTISHETYENNLKLSFHSNMVRPDIHFIGPIKHSDLTQLFENHDILLHAFRGSLDKVLLEATLSGIPVITTNEEFINQFGLWSNSHANMPSELFFFLQRELESMFDMTEINFYKTLKTRRDIVRLNHSLDRWITQILTRMNL